jgi:hypothetical protein
LDFQQRNINDWVPVIKHVTALDETVGNFGQINQPVITGGSYAGYLTAVISMTIVLGSVHNVGLRLNTFLEECFEIGAKLFEVSLGTKVKEILARESPINYANITTPFIIFMG